MAHVHLQPAHRFIVLDSPLRSAVSPTASTTVIGAEVAGVLLTDGGLFVDDSVLFSQLPRLLPIGARQPGKLPGGAQGGGCGAAVRLLCSVGPHGPPARLQRLRRRHPARSTAVAPPPHVRKNGEGQVVIFRVVRISARMPCVFLTPFTPLYTRVCGVVCSGA